MRFHSYLNTAAFIIETYDGTTPLVHHLKHYFAQFKKHGSKDRKFISHLCYCYFRLGKVLEQLVIAERIKLGLFLCNIEAGAWGSLYDEQWLNNWSDDVNLRIAFVQQHYPAFKLQEIFRFSNEAVKTGAKYDHDTVKPETLTRVLILTCSRQNDLVLAPFAGSGTEVAMAIKEGRKAIGYDIEKKYVDMANRRVDIIKAQPSLFCFA